MKQFSEASAEMSTLEKLLQVGTFDLECTTACDRAQSTPPSNDDVRVSRPPLNSVWSLGEHGSVEITVWNWLRWEHLCKTRSQAA